MLLVIAVPLLAAGVFLLAVGLRGRVVDDHPLCRRCGYDQTGRPADVTRCGECGANLSTPRAVRVGHRVRRRGLMLVGSVLLVASLSVLAIGGQSWASTVNWAAYKPTWWLKHDLSGTASERAASLAELAVRVSDGKLSAADVAFVADRAFTAQAGPTFWAKEWGAFVEAAHAAGRLDRGRWATYGRQGITARMVTRPLIRRGDPMPVSFDFAAGRLAAAGFGAFFDIRGLTLDGRPVGKDQDHSDWTDTGGHTGRFAVATGSMSASYASPDLGRASGRLIVGPHTLAGTMRVFLYDAAEMGGQRADGGPVVPAVSKQLGEFDVPLAAALAVCDPAHEPPVTVVDPARRAAVAAAVQVRSAKVADGTLTVDVMLDSPPVRLSFRAFVRPSGGGPEVKLQFHEQATPGSSRGYLDPVDWPPGSADTIDVIFRPDVAYARDSVDTTPIWGEEVVVKALPVTRTP